MINTLEKRQIGPKRTFRDRLFDYSCQKLGKEKTKVFFKLYDMGRFDLFGKPKGAIGVIDITNCCNLSDEILDKLLRLKEEKYGDFIGVPSLVLKLMKSDRCKEITRNCIFKEVSFCLDPQGQIKKPYMIGPQADCLRCGCVLPFHMWALEDKCLMARKLLMSLRHRIGKWIPQ